MVRLGGWDPGAGALLQDPGLPTQLGVLVFLEVSMAKIRYDVATPIETEKGATSWHRIGSAIQDEVGGKIVISLKSLPFRSSLLYLFPHDNGPKERED